MQPTTVLLNEATQKDLQALAEQQGKTTDEVVQEAIQFYILSVQKNVPLASQTLDRRAFMKLPIEERRRILAEQAEAMTDHYEQDSEWREWANFDVGEIYDEG